MFPDFPFGGRDRHLLSAVSQRGALSFFVILSRIAGCAVNIGLVASQFMRNIFQHLTAVVDTAVALFGYPELSDQLKIGGSSSLPDNECVGFQTVSRFDLTTQTTVFCPQEIGRVQCRERGCQYV